MRKCNVLHMSKTCQEKTGSHHAIFNSSYCWFNPRWQETSLVCTLHLQVSKSVTAPLCRNWWLFSFISRYKGTNKFVFKHGSRPLSLPWRAVLITSCQCLPTSHFACGFLTPSPEGYSIQPHRGKGKPPWDQSELGSAGAGRLTLWKDWLLSIPSGLGGAEVRKSNQEREQRKYKEKEKRRGTGWMLQILHNWEEVAVPGKYIICACRWLKRQAPLTVHPLLLKNVSTHIYFQVTS